jgi:hypothetical protein
LRANRRFDARRDDTEPDIVDALQKAGWKVWRELPVDLLLWHPVKGYRTLEAKSEGKPLVPKKGPQEAFIALTGCPIVNNGEDAIKAVEPSP